MTPADDVERNPSWEDEGLPDIQQSDSEQADTGEGLHQTLPPRDYAQALDEYGTTAGEQRDGEPLDVRLDREEPDPSGNQDSSGEAAGRLVEPASEEVDSVDTTAESVARETGYDAGGVSAEEAAVRIDE